MLEFQVLNIGGSVDKAPRSLGKCWEGSDWGGKSEKLIHNSGGERVNSGVFPPVFFMHVLLFSL